jgi:hypothetical protein
LRDMFGIDISIIELFVFIILISLIIIVTVRTFKRVKNESNVFNIDKELILVSLFFIVFSLALPRFKDYDYVLLILPCFFVINKLGSINPKYLLVFIFIISSIRITLPGIKVLYSLFWEYYPLFLAILSWGLYIFYLNRFSKVTESKTLQNRLQE